MLNNSAILKRVLPFLAIFIFSLSYAGYTFIQQATAPAKAEGEDITVDIVNIKAPINTTSLWQWNAIVVINNFFKDPVRADYTVNWCSGTTGQKGPVTEKCDPEKYGTDFKGSLLKGTMTIQAKNSITKIEHQAIDCGRVQISVNALGKTEIESIYDTGVECSDLSANALSATTGLKSGSSAMQIIRDFLDILPIGDIEENVPDSGIPSPGEGSPPPGSDEKGKQNPQGISLSCPISNGIAFIGSRDNPINGSGHCAPGYAFPENCNQYPNEPAPRAEYWGTAYAFDMGGTGGQTLLLPTVNGEVVEWIHVDETGKGSQAIQRFTTKINGDDYLLQYHHAQPGSGPGVGNSKLSGQIGATIWSGGNHVHTQLGLGSSRAGAWVDATRYFTCGNL
ncbi:hypothetical protein A2966_05235 [Candidatus Roizmanbacteria bacterium RIFCSPLOWO2_01_FULL_41_22]|uniref:Uncharacterized protein n=2 Tax=Candidatus Roizmaniibacteriota TaxID=1752723 RepID=A0A1F7I6W6_9BACT|nr:MAG: hypothetical protein A3F34_01140 [Candidatus Roizmanbacteria bacterium RIFCSPHIGHO2_12_FULL_44_10]OGK52523.1 MAG: hypothetical protein A2966_05235 [Candidatus Roizmanbacteria bacterium RIFCSPLOWO2_01_FULL_41_22]